MRGIKPANGVHGTSSGKCSCNTLFGLSESPSFVKLLQLSGGKELVIEENPHQEIFENCAYRNRFGLSSNFLKMFILSRRWLRIFFQV